MPAVIENGRSKRHKVGYIAVGFKYCYDFWYSSEGVFSTKKAAIKDLEFNYSPDFSYAVKIDLKIPKKVVI